MKSKLRELLNYWPMFLFGLFLFGLGFGACSHSGTRGVVEQDERIINERIADRIHVFEYDGHEYLIYQDRRVGGITHSGSCKKCKQNGSN